MKGTLIKELVHIRLVSGKTRIITTNLCQYGLYPTNLPKITKLTNVTCQSCLTRWREERR